MAGLVERSVAMLYAGFPYVKLINEVADENSIDNIKPPPSLT